MPPPVYNGHTSLNELRTMEEAIRRKSQIIKDIEYEIKMLKNGTYFENKKNGDQTSALVGDIVSKKESLINVQKTYLGKIK